jgi:hypothetical protein
MSGNGPLVRVLREALTRDRLTRTRGRRSEIERKVDVLIQNVHVMAREHWDDKLARAPQDRVVVFDEAQRAWNAKQNKRKFERNISEPEMLLSIMDRHPDWAVIVALVGGGQEINDGEAGLREWGRALENKFTHWRVLASPEAINGGPAVAGSTLFDKGLPHGLSVEVGPEFHLPVSTRSYRAKAVAEWTNAVLDGDLDSARAIAISCESPIALVTRDLTKAKSYLSQSTEGTARCGLLASSAAIRLRAYGLETATSFHRSYKYEYWFLNGREDVRSSFQLEVVATEFEVQGLELDVVCLCWGLDLAFLSDQWVPRKLSSTIWSPNKPVATRWSKEKGDPAIFRKNAYRVLMTRARQQLVIWIPQGKAGDPTNSEFEYDNIFSALLKSGASELALDDLPT